MVSTLVRRLLETTVCVSVPLHMYLGFLQRRDKKYICLLSSRPRCLWLPWKWTDPPGHTKPGYRRPLGNLSQSAHSRVTTPGPLSPTPKALCPLGFHLGHRQPLASLSSSVTWETPSCSEPFGGSSLGRGWDGHRFAVCG